jgi:transposase
MATGKPRDLRKEQLWRQRIQDWQRSGLTVRAFCQRRGLAVPSFYAWRRVLQERQAPATPFLPVHVVPEQPPGPAAAVELLLAGGRTVRVAPGFDAATLRRVLAVLEETSC